MRHQVVDLDGLGHDADLLLGEPKRLAHLFGRGGSAQPVGQDRACSLPLREQAHHVGRQPDRLAIVHHGPADRLLDPVAGVGAKPGLHHSVEALNGTHQAEVPFLDQVFQAQALAQVSPRNVYHQPQIGLDHVLASVGISRGNPLGQLALLLGRE